MDGKESKWAFSLIQSVEAREEEEEERRLVRRGGRGDGRKEA